MSHPWDIALGLVVISNARVLGTAAHRFRKDSQMNFSNLARRNGIRAMVSLCMLGAGAAVRAGFRMAGGRLLHRRDLGHL